MILKPAFPSLFLTASLAAAAFPATVPDQAPEMTESLARWENRLGDRDRLLKRVELWQKQKPETIAATVSRKLAFENVKERRKASIECLEAAMAFYELSKLPDEPAREAHAASAKAILDPLLKALPHPPEVTAEGGKDPNNLRLRDAAWAYALRYQITNDPGDLAQASRLLLEFADKMKGWPVLLNRTGNQWVSQTSPRLARSEDSGGFWGRWPRRP